MYDWSNYTILTDEMITDYFYEHDFENKKSLYILGEGFDERMCVGLSRIQEYLNNTTVWKIHYSETKDSQSKLYSDLIEKNLLEYEKLVSNIETKDFNIDMWTEGIEERFIAEIMAAKFIKDHSEEIGQYENIIIDISALPQSIYYPLLKRLCQDWLFSKEIYIFAGENYMTDMDTMPVELAETAHQMHGFGEGNLPNDDCIVIWFPVLGEINAPSLQKYYDYLNRTYSKIDEICPVLPFPSVDIRRLDMVIDGYRKLIFSQWEIEKRNLIYVAENNPFQVYRMLYETAEHYSKVIEPIGKCRFVFSTITSKLMGIGAFLSAIALRENGYRVDFLNISNKGYRLKEGRKILLSKLYCLCLTDTGL